MLYFDHNATTPVAPEVAEAFAAAVRELWGNASSVHAQGRSAREALDRSRREIAAALHASANEIVFTSGGTEANNLAVFGALRDRAAHVITTAIEHPAVLEACRRLPNVTFLRPDQAGVVHPEQLADAIRPDTALISIMHANNETGVLQPIAAIAKIARENGIPMHSDGVQAFGRIPVDVETLGVDLYSISGHKLYAPKGVGALFVGKRAKLSPIQFGGRHERERRPGTENVPAIAALARAVQMGIHATTRGIRDYFETQIRNNFGEIAINGERSERIPNTSSVTFDGASGEAVVIGLDMRGMAVSSGSACSSGSSEPSHVLLQMGRSREQARSTVRFSFGRSNSRADVDALLDALHDVVGKLRRKREVLHA